MKGCKKSVKKFTMFIYVLYATVLKREMEAFSAWFLFNAELSAL